MKFLPAIDIRNNLQSKFNDKLNEVEELFYNGSKFDGKYRTYTPISEDERDNDYKDAYLVKYENTKEEVAFKVNDVLDDLMKIFEKYMNACLTVEEANSNNNKAELRMKDKLVGSFSGQTLLCLEKNYKKIIDILKKIPVLNMNHKWEPSKEENGVFEYTDIVNCTVTVSTFIFSPTNEHQSPTSHEVNRRVTVGVYKDRYLSGKIIKITKDKLIENAEKILNDIKIAKNEANNIDVKKYSIDFSSSIY